MSLIRICLLCILMFFTFETVASQSIEVVECRFETTIEGVECFDLAVPEDHMSPESPRIKIHVAIIRAREENPSPDPIVYLAGGPGGHTLATLDNFRVFANLYQTRDLIIVDQRGVGTSQPALDCPEIAEYEYQNIASDLAGEALLQSYLNAVQNCRDRLTADGVQLGAYHTDNVAADIESLRLALDYPVWNIFATSYGTSIAQTILRDYPEGVRSVILDSPLALDSSWVLNAPNLASQAFGKFFEACQQANDDCADLESVLFELAERWNETPLSTTINFFGSSYSMILDGDEVLANVYRALYFTQGISDLPGAIYAAQRGEYERIGTYELYDVWEPTGYSMGMNFSILCADVGQAIPSSNGDTRFSTTFGVGEVLRVCETWDTQPRPDTTPLQSSDVPALLLVGEFDPVAPLETAESIAEAFELAYIVELRGLSHLNTFSSACPRSIMADFLEATDQTPDMSCAGRLASPLFILGSGD